MMMMSKPKRKITTVVIAHKDKPDFAQGIGEKSNGGEVDMSGDEKDDSVAIESAALKLCRGVEAKDSKVIASALKEAFSILCNDEEGYSEGGQVGIDRGSTPESVGYNPYMK